MKLTQEQIEKEAETLYIQDKNDRGYLIYLVWSQLEPNLQDKWRNLASKKVVT